MTPASDFQPFEHGHHDIVLAAAYNFYGDRLVTASADHRLKVWDRKATGWVSLDVWRAHDGEVTDVKWNGPFTGTFIGSIAEDGMFKLWSEDMSQAADSGRRFTCIRKFPSKSSLPWQFLDFKNIDSDTYLALITRDGRLSIMEPLDHDRLEQEWRDWFPNLEDFNVCAPAPTPSRGEEASFKVVFHQEKLPCWTAVQAGLDRKAISLAVVCMNSVKIYRTDRDRRLYLAAHVPDAPDLVRDLAWANGSMRGWDTLAIACKDGAIYIYKLETPTSSAQKQLSDAAVASFNFGSDTNAASQKRSGPPLQSAISAALMGSSRPQASFEEDQRLGRIRQVATLEDKLINHHGAVWRVIFSHAGDVLTSTGDDGNVRTWKKAIDNRWLEFAEIEINSRSNRYQDR